ncbi:MAG: hypothetical protein J5825_10470, partial [Lachnospiraceae bacterium]|nr:hypothetical protein [Lachnospiraceae bacterium]
MKKNQNKYQLPKNHIVLPVILYTVIFLLVLFVIGTYSNVFVSYTTSLKTRADSTEVRSYAEEYDLTSTPEEELEYLKKLDHSMRSNITDSSEKEQGPVVFTANKNGILYPEDGNVSVIFNPDQDLLDNPEDFF